MGKLKKKFHSVTAAELKKELFWLWQRVLRYKGFIALVGLLGLLGTLMSLASSVASKYLIDAVAGFGRDMLAKAAASTGDTPLVMVR